MVSVLTSVLEAYQSIVFVVCFVQFEDGLQSRENLLPVSEYAQGHTWLLVALAMCASVVRLPGGIGVTVVSCISITQGSKLKNKAVS